MATESKFLGQGTYGCIYKPNIRCLNEKPPNKNSKQIFISKLQIKTVASEREANLGKIIKSKIKKYNTMFAPIIDSCQVDIAQIDKNEIEKCKVITDNIESETKVEYTSYKMRFAGKQSIGNYYKTLLKKPKLLLKRMLETHIYLLKSLNILGKLTPPIIHYDLKDNNIMYNEKIGKPIIIDFGLSFELNISKQYDQAIALEQYYVFYEKYPPWCIELVILQYITQKLVVPITEKITEKNINELNHICNTFVNENDVFQVCSQPEIDQYENNLYLFISTYLGKTWDNLFQDLQKTNESWDNYSMSTIFLFHINDLLLATTASPIIAKYQTILKRVILGGFAATPVAAQANVVAPNVDAPNVDAPNVDAPNPATRPTITNCINELTTMAGTINKKQYKKLVKDIDETLSKQLPQIIINMNNNSKLNTTHKK